MNMVFRDVAERYAYEPDTGLLRWKVPAYQNIRKVGDTAGGRVGNGYLNAYIGRKPYGVHRLAWLLMTGTWPTDEIDHINGERADNRWSNLRAANREQNCHNLPLFKTNRSGVAGVFWHKAVSKWWAYINAGGKRQTLGYFEDFFEAVCARRSAESRLFGEFLRVS